MKIQDIILSGLFSLLLMVYVGRSQAEELHDCQLANMGGPEDVVRILYKNYSSDDTPAIKNEPKGVLLKYFDNNLTKLILLNQECEKSGDLCYIDYDILYAAQDFDIKKFRICAIDQKTNVVEVNFLNFDKPETIRFQLVKTTNGWKISDIIDASGSLASYLSSQE